MVEPSGSWLRHQRSPWEASAYRNCMIAPVEHRQHESLPALINPCRVSANLGLNGFSFSSLPERGLTSGGNGPIQKSAPQSQIPFTQNQCQEEQNSLFAARVSEKPSVCEVPCTQPKKFLIFDRSGNETRLVFSSLCPRVENLTTPQTTCPAWNLPPEESFGAYNQYLAEKQGRIIEQAWTRTPALCEESGENEIIDNVSEMREDTDEINALLYSEDDYDDDDNEDDAFDDYEEDNDEVSSGHSPLAKEQDCEKQEEDDEKGSDNEVASLERSSKRQKSLHGRCNVLHQSSSCEDVVESVCPTNGTKRPRKDKIHDTLKVLESIIPNLKSKNPLVILEEAISYLKCLKYNAESMSSEDPDSSGCYEPLN